MKTENGRSMVEMLGVLAIMGVLSVTGIWAYGNAIDSHKANRILNDLNARIHDCSAQMVMMNKDECQLSSFPDKMDDAYATSVQKIDSDFFKVIISDIPQKICQQILNKGIPLASHINLTNCNETNQFELIFHKNLDSSIFRKKCTSDVDCDVCGSCDSDGYCLDECSLPSPDSEENCGENECIVYDEESKTCRDACERVEYLESTGSQYINTGVINIFYTLTDKILLGFEATNVSNPGFLFGVQPGSRIIAIRTVNSKRLQLGFWWGYIPEEDNVETIYKKFDIEISENGFILDGIKQTGDIGSGRPTSGEIPLYIGASAGFYASNSEEFFKTTKGKYYYLKIYRNDLLVRDFIPVIAPDGEACMFDKVSKKLFCNAGSGTFKTNKD